MPFRRPIAAAVCALIAVVAASGCGGKEKVSATELVQKGDAICRDEQSRFSEIQAHPPANASEAADQTKALVSAAEDANGKLGDFEPPEDLQSRYADYLDARERATDQIRKGQDAAERQDSSAYGAAQSAVADTAPKRRALARSLGFRVCSSGGPGAAV